MFNRIKEFFIGKAKNPLESEVFQKISLVAFLAWVGLGADGLSSSSYGPEHAFRELTRQVGMGNLHLALYLVFATAITVAVICASYAMLIELFPTGGGGYLVASKLLGETPGLVAGGALVVNYTLTISISIAAGVDALFSFLPAGWVEHKLGAQTFFILMLIWLNLRGVKESILVLVPIFLLFIATHILLIGSGLIQQSSHMAELVPGMVSETSRVVNDMGWWPFFVALFAAYSIGGGTYTGIEAISNGMGALREPKVQTGRKTMLYTGVSLALTAGGILMCYMLFDIGHVEGKTMNAVLSEAIFSSWEIGGLHFGKGVIYITLLSEALLLFIASQTGFLGGSAVLANMAIDSWVPHRFANLSERLVTRNGLLAMGIPALAINWVTGGSVKLLVVMYSINVFIGFCLSQLGMCVHWIKVRRQGKPWFWKFMINGTGLMMTSSILIATIFFKFTEGAWVTLVLTGTFLGLCVLVRRHYIATDRAMKRLDDMLINLPFPEAPPEEVPPAPEGPTAVLLVSQYNGLGIHAIFSIRKLFKHQEFKNLLFVSVGVIDSSKFKGTEEMDNLREETEKQLRRYVDLAKRMGYHSEYRMDLGINKVEVAVKLCEDVADEFVEPIFFSGKLIFAEDNLFTQALHNQTSLDIQRKLLFKGHNMIVVPVRVL